MKLDLFDNQINENIYIQIERDNDHINIKTTIPKINNIFTHKYNNRRFAANLTFDGYTHHELLTTNMEERRRFYVSEKKIRYCRR